MLSSTVLEVVTGLVFCYASVSIISSTVYEAIASVLKLRAGYLLGAIKAMLNDPDFVGLAQDLYNHALVNPRASGSASSEEQLTSKPSYIDSTQFATALIDCIQQASPTSFLDLGAKIDALGDIKMRHLLKTLYARSDGRIESLNASLAAWFDTGMARVSGSYKRNAQLFSFVIAFTTAASFNIDSFHLFHVLWAHPALVVQLGTPTAQTASQALEGLKDLPVGWEAFPPPPTAIFGWLVTASSALFGAPFWFDLLQRMVNIRGTGPKPEDKKG